MISETLAAVEKKTEISDFFQLRIRILRYCGKKRISETLAAVDFFSKISDFFSTGAKAFLWMPKKWPTLLRQKKTKTLSRS